MRNLIPKTQYPGTLLSLIIDCSIGENNAMVVYELQELLASAHTYEAFQCLHEGFSKDDFLFLPSFTVLDNSQPDHYIEHLTLPSENGSTDYCHNLTDILSQFGISDDGIKGKKLLIVDPYNASASTIYAIYRNSTQKNLVWSNLGGGSFIDYLLRNKALQRYVINATDPGLNPPYFLMHCKKYRILSC